MYQFVYSALTPVLKGPAFARVLVYCVEPLPANFLRLNATTRTQIEQCIKLSMCAKDIVVRDFPFIPFGGTILYPAWRILIPPNF